MILNPIRIVRCALIARDIARKLAARRSARNRGEVLVVQHTRRK